MKEWFIKATFQGGGIFSRSLKLLENFNFLESIGHKIQLTA